MSAPVKFKDDAWRDYRHPITRAKLPGKSEIVDNIGWRCDGLMGYAFKLARDGRNPWADRTWRADTGTLAHTFIEQTLRGEEVKAPEGVHPTMMSDALVALSAWKRWAAGKQIEVIALEVPLIDGEMGYGTTLDAVLRVDGCAGIYDWKTGKMHAEMVVGMSACCRAWNLHSPEKIHDVFVVRCPTDGSAPEQYHFDQALLHEGAVAFTAARVLETQRTRIELPKPTIIEEEGF